MTGPGRWQVGSVPDSDSSELSKAYVDAQMQSLLVTTAFVNSQIALAGQSLVTKAYIDNSNSQLAQKTAVDNADLNYVPTTARGVASGVAALDSSGMVIASQIPSNVPVEYIARSYNAVNDGAIYLAANASHRVTSSTLREFELASIPLPDPGFPWIPWCFGIVLGGDPTAPADPGRTVGTGNYGLLSVLPPAGISDTVYGVGLCTATYRPDFYKVKPYATNNQLPAPIHGSLSLGLYGCCWTGSEYTFSGAGLNFWVAQFPAMGT